MREKIKTKNEPVQLEEAIKQAINRSGQHNSEGLRVPASQTALMKLETGDLELGAWPEDTPAFNEINRGRCRTGTPTRRKANKSGRSGKR
mmetsp:Transcript_32268/g.48739  ORF Transcript_32268/g.48739 Transcript_32268/m.48739 type:complete len:90 (+) Transcript_32268:849-1118(+)